MREGGFAVYHIRHCELVSVMSKIVNRTLDFFELFAAEKRPLSLSELMKLLEIPVSSCFDVVRALERRGFLYELRPRGGYYPTRRLHELGRVLLENDPFLQRAHPELERLRDASGETVLLAKSSGEDLTYIDAVESTQVIRFIGTVGAKVRSLYATSAGKAYLGSLPEAERKKRVARLALKPFTAKTIVSKERLLEDIRACERRGWFLNREESIADCITVSARVSWNGALYFVTVAAVKSRMEKQLDACVKHLLAACRAIQQIPGPSKEAT